MKQQGEKPDFEQVRAGVFKSIEELERQATDQTLPRPVRNRAAWAAMRRKQLVRRHPRLFGTKGGNGR